MHRRHTMSSIRKISWLVGITGLVLAMASGTASGNGFVPDTIVIYENDNGIGPEITFICPQNPCQFAYDTGSPQGTTESVTINGTLTTVGPTTQITMGTYTVLLTEGPPGLTTPISDIVTLTAGPTSTNLGFEQHITITFTSDSEIGLPSNLTCATTICLAETGTVQDMFCF